MNESNQTFAAHFLDELNQFDAESIKVEARPIFKDEVEKARFDFVKECGAQIDLIVAGQGTRTTTFGQPVTKWTERLADGKRFKVGFKCGSVTLELIPGKHFFTVPDAEAAAAVIAKAAITAEEEGFDEHFAKALAQRKKPKPKSVARSLIAEQKQSWQVA